MVEKNKDSLQELDVDGGVLDYSCSLSTGYYKGEKSM